MSRKHRTFSVKGSDGKQVVGVIVGRGIEIGEPIRLSDDPNRRQRRNTNTEEMSKLMQWRGGGR